MVVRTTAVAIGLIIEVEEDDSLTSFIEVANNVVTKHCVDEDYTAADLELIERWLSAHFYCMFRARTESEKAGPTGEKFQSKVDLGFDLSHYGSMAMRLAWGGELSALNEMAKRGGKTVVGVTALGTDNDDITIDPTG